MELMNPTDTDIDEHLMNDILVIENWYLGISAFSIFMTNKLVIIILIISKWERLRNFLKISSKNHLVEISGNFN